MKMVAFPSADTGFYSKLIESIHSYNFLSLGHCAFASSLAPLSPILFNPIMKISIPRERP